MILLCFFNGRSTCDYLAPPWLFTPFLRLGCITSRLSGSLSLLSWPWSRSITRVQPYSLLGYFYCICKKCHLSWWNKHFQPVKQSSLFEVNKKACLSKGSTISIMPLCTTFFFAFKNSKNDVLVANKDCRYLIVIPYSTRVYYNSYMAIKQALLKPSFCFQAD